MMIFNLQGKVAVVTGGAQNLGLAYAKALHNEGATVYILDNQKTKGDDAERSLGCKFLHTDVTSATEVKSAFSEIARREQKIDVLINNAGAYPHDDIESISKQRWDRIIEINLNSAFLCSMEAFGHMKAQKCGKIINIVTNLCFMLVPNMAHYISAKMGVLGFTRASAQEFGAHGITINALAPGAVMPSTPPTESDIVAMRTLVGYQALKRPLLPVDLIGPLLFFCSEHSDFITGQVLCIDGGVGVC